MIWLKIQKKIYVSFERFNKMKIRSQITKIKKKYFKRIKIWPYFSKICDLRSAFWFN
jgi:hypothetical protein